MSNIKSCMRIIIVYESSYALARQRLNRAISQAGRGKKVSVPVMMKCTTPRSDRCQVQGPEPLDLGIRAAYRTSVGHSRGVFDHQNYNSKQ